MIKKLFTRPLLFFAISIYPCLGFAQPAITIEASQVFSKFKFIDSKGTTDKDYTYALSGAYGIGYRNTTPKNILFRANVGMRKGGSSLTFNNNNYSWNMQYLDVKLGAGYALNKWRISPYAIVSPYYAFLLKATQTINTQNYDIQNSNSIQNSDYGLVLTPGVNFNASDYFSIFLEYNYYYGLQNIEVNSNQKLFNRAYSVSLGISAKITKKSPKWLQEKK